MTEPNWDPRGTAGTSWNIGLWGPPQSGKTTFLSALNIAVERSAADIRLYGADRQSAGFLAEGTNLLRNRIFPPATEAVRSLAWTLGWTYQQPVQRTVGEGRRARTEWDYRTVGRQMTLMLRDAPGRVFGGTSGITASQARDSRLLFGDERYPASAAQPVVVPDDGVIDHLAGAQGMILLVDPVEERETGSAYSYFQATVAEVAQQRLTRLSAGARLPHYIAVCMNKFDHPEVYGFAQRGEYRSFDQSPQRFPRIPEDHAERFFLDFCIQSNESDIDLFASALKRFFRKDRIRFFVTSSIGFYLDRAAGVFSEDDYQNTVQQVDGTYRIRGRINPINVLEPLLWLGSQGGGS